LRGINAQLLLQLAPDCSGAGLSGIDMPRDGDAEKAGIVIDCKSTPLKKDFVF
jgi:hypothetical protein